MSDQSKYVVKVQPGSGDEGEEVVVYLSRVARAMNGDVEKMYRLVDSFFNRIGVDGHREGKAVGQLISEDHPTMQSVMIAVMTEAILVLSEKQYTDARNAQSIELCRRLAEVIREAPKQSYI